MSNKYKYSNEYRYKYEHSKEIKIIGGGAKNG